MSDKLRFYLIFCVLLGVGLLLVPHAPVFIRLLGWSILGTAFLGLRSEEEA